DAVAPFHFDLIAGGHSNLTYRVTDGAATRYVLRRPPLGEVLASAHDMAREHGIITALCRTGVRAPRVLALCSDTGITGAVFYVMEEVEGLVLRNAQEASSLEVAARERASSSLVHMLAAVHRVDPVAVGLGG